MVRKIEGFNIDGEKGARQIKRVFHKNERKLPVRKIVGMLILLSFLSGCAVVVRPVPPGLFTPIPLHIHIMRIRMDIMHTNILIIIVGIGILVVTGTNREHP